MHLLPVMLLFEFHSDHCVQDVLHCHEGKPLNLNMSVKVLCHPGHRSLRNLEKKCLDSFK